MRHGISMLCILVVCIAVQSPSIFPCSFRNCSNAMGHPFARHPIIGEKEFIASCPLCGAIDKVILNIPRGSLVLLDTRRKLKTTITTSQLMAFTAAVKSAATSTDRSRLVAPQFQEKYDSANQVLTLSDVQLTYRVEAIKPQHPDCAQRFQLFADWYARLNATRVGNPPPFGRIELNRSLAKRGLIPAQIERTVGPTTLPDRQQKMRSRHLTNWQLTDTDRKRIHRAEEYCKHFQEVTADRYWQTEPLPPGTPVTD